MPDFDFYGNTYLGERIQERAFPQLATRAAGVLGSYARSFRVTGSDTERKMAICAMAEVLQDHDRRCRHSTASVGNVSVRYEKPRQSLQTLLYQAASTYLQFYRGVS